MIELSPTQAKRLVVASQGLNKNAVFGRGEAALLQCIEQLGYVQVDTISVIKRAHHHTLWTRIPKYQECHLDSLQRERKIFEYWSHAAAYLPMQDYRFCLPYMNAIASGEKHWRTPDKKTMKLVLDRIRQEGPLKARDFENSKNAKSNAWGGQKPAKIALEQLFIEGQLMISHREGFQKVYDVAERVLPEGVNTTTPTTNEYCRYLVERTILSQGVAAESEMGYLRKGIRADLRKVVQEMVAERSIVQVGVKGNSSVYYSWPDLIAEASSIRVAKKVHLLSPFDNLVIQRKRVAQLFDYDYQIECYIPEKKRVHGYFCLPILFGNDLVGRLDPKVDRTNQTLLIRNLVIEREISQLDAFISGLARKIKELAGFNGCRKILLERCNKKQLISALSRLVG